MTERRRTMKKKREQQKQRPKKRRPPPCLDRAQKQAGRMKQEIYELRIRWQRLWQLEREQI
jgi:hypothetical protein